MDAKKLNIGLTSLKFIVAIVGVVLSVFLFTAPNVEAGTEAVETYRDSSVVFSSAIWFTIITLIILVGFVLLFFFVQLITNAKKTVISILGILIFLAIYLVMNMMGTGDTNESLMLDRNPVSQSIINTTSAGIYTILIGMGAGLLVIVLGPLMGRFRK